MLDEGKYAALWNKYAAAIHVLLKKTDTESQKLQLYKNEFEYNGHKPTVNVTFSFNMINGRALNIISTTTIARDLFKALDKKPATRLLMENRKIRFSFGKNFELVLEKIADEVTKEIEEVVSDEVVPETAIA